MSDDSIVFSRHGIFRRLRGAVRGMVVGVFLVLLSLPVLFLNEGRAVRTAKALAEGSGAVVSVSADNVDSRNDGKLVHVTGIATTTEVLGDREFGVSLPAIRLRRKVEMYQWVEEESRETRTTRTGGERETVVRYRYDKDWKDRVIDSAKFHDRSGHQNPPSMRIKSEVFSAGVVTLGAFTLPVDLAEKIPGRITVQPLAPATDDSNTAPSQQLRGDTLYIGGNPDAPAVGDIRVRWDAVTPTVVSIVAKQAGNTFRPYAVKSVSDREIALLRGGILTAPEMFDAEVARNTMVTWLLRAGGFMLLWIGFLIILRPLVVVADVIPVLGRLAGMAVVAASLVPAAGISLLVISTGWMFYRPLVGIPLLLLGVAILVLGVWKFRPRP